MLGYPAATGELRALCAAHGLALVEDAAQGFGVDAPRGDVACLSFFSKKQLAVGEGGMVLTDDEAVAERVRLLRSHAMTSGTWDRHRGHEDSYDVVDFGFNFRLDEPRAALGLARLPKVAAEIEHRRVMVRAYRERLGAYAMFDDAAVERASHFAFTVLFEDVETRVRVREALAAARHPDHALPGRAPPDGVRALRHARSRTARARRRPPPRAPALRAHDARAGRARQLGGSPGSSRSRIASNSAIACS